MFYVLLTSNVMSSFEVQPHYRCLSCISRVSAVSVPTVIFVAVIPRGKVGSHNGLLLVVISRATMHSNSLAGSFKSTLTAISLFYVHLNAI